MNGEEQLIRRAESPLNESEAAAVIADVKRGRHLAAICGEHRVTIGEVLRLRREYAEPKQQGLF